MANVVNATVTALYRYPVKTFAAEALQSAPLIPGQSFPADRMYALQTSRVAATEKSNDEVVPGLLFLRLLRTPVLAGLSVKFDDATHELTVTRGGTELISANLASGDGRKRFETFVRTGLGPDYKTGVYVVAKSERDFSRGMDTYLHIINLASIRDLEQRIGAPVDPLRFRPNVVIDGLPAWSELDMLDRKFTINGATLDVIERAERCPATTCDPQTGISDIKIPDILRATFKHKDFGIYARVVEGGTLTIGDTIG